MNKKCYINRNNVNTFTFDHDVFLLPYTMFGSK